MSKVLVLAMCGTILAGVASAAQPVDALQVVEAQVFLDQYRTASNAQSTDFYDLYSDRAVVHARVEGREAGMSFQGRAYKQWGRDLLQAHRIAIDSSEFHEATVERRGFRLLIRAKRYSITRCYWDTNYQLGIEKEGANYRIVYERLTTVPAGRCQAVNSSNKTTAGGSLPSELSPSGQNEINFPNRSGWRPMSQSEIAESAMRLALRAASSYPSQIRQTSPPHAEGGTPVAPMALQSRPADEPNPLWLTPQ